MRESDREWHHHLDPGPLRDIYWDYLSGFAPVWEERLLQLKRLVEAGDMQSQDSS